MADFLTTKGSLSKIEDVIRDADKALTVITPFVQISEDFARRLRDADERGVQIRLVCRVETLKPAQKSKLAEFVNLTVYDDPKLHAKCFINESGLVLTSLNFYQASEQNNEMGIYLDAREDRRAFSDAVKEAESIIRSAREESRVGERSPAKRKQKKTVKPGRFSFISKGEKRSKPAGHCIRCGTGMDYDPKKPYCGRCFRQWLRFKNPTYSDGRCHGCGKEETKAFSLEKPECYACYKSGSAVEA